jgi:DNA-binding transcriptional LysR family regulator
MRFLQDLALFIELVNTRSFTRAAANLDMPASTLSRRIAGLEQEIGVPLFVRTTRKVEVTEAGAAYYARCAHLVDEAQLAHRQLTDEIQSVSGRIRVTCTPDFASLYLPPLLAGFLAQYPGIQMELDLTTHHVDLVTEHLDAALRFGPLGDSSLVARRIAVLHHALYASPSYLASKPAPKHPDDLCKHNCLRMKQGYFCGVWSLRRRRGLHGMDSCDVPVSGSVIVSSVTAIHELVLHGCGIGCIDRNIASDDLRQGRLLEILPAWELPPVELHLVTTSRWMPARIKAFGDFLAAQLDKGG